MKFEFTTADVLPKLRRVTSVVSTKNSVQILSDICITIKGQNLIMTASDSTMWLTERASLVNADSDMMFCVLASDFMNAMNNLGDVNVRVEMNTDTKSMTCKYGKGKFVMPFESAEDYPRPFISSEEKAEVFVPSAEMSAAISMCKLAAGNDILRPIINGIHFDFIGGDMICTATDIYKLVRYVGHGIANANQDSVGFTLPQRAASVASMVMQDEEVKLTLSDNNLVISSNDYKMTTVLIEGVYPNCDRIIPNDNPFLGKISKTDFVQGLTRILTMGDKTSSLVKMQFAKDGVTISAEDFDYSKSASETIEYESNIEEEILVGCKGTTLIELLKNVDEDIIRFELASPANPIIIYGAESLQKDSYLSMLMPVTL